MEKEKVEKEKLEKTKLELVNEEIKTLPITRVDKKTGSVVTKQYAEVAQRIKAFRKLYPEGTIETEILKFDEKMCLMKAIVKDKDGKILGIGHALEEKNSSFINSTSYLENAETSAIGRALGVLGIGIDAGLASYEEVKNAEKQRVEASTQQNEKNASVETSASQKKASEKQINLITNLYTQEEIDKMISRIGVAGLSEITLTQASKMITARKEKNVQNNVQEGVA